jgi:hypothetical protein
VKRDGHFLLARKIVETDYEKEEKLIMSIIKFEVGEKYENMKGVYEVLSVEGNAMRIRWESGEEIVTTVSLQRQIIIRMTQEQRNRKG